MRVLWITNMWPDKHRPWYGSFVYSQAQSLSALGAELDVLYIPGYQRRSEYARGVLELRRRLRSTRFDLVHAHYGHSGVVARVQWSAPLVVSYCGDDLLGTPAAEGSGRMTPTSVALARAFAQLARVSAATITKSRAMERCLPGASRLRNHVIPNGVDLEFFAPLDHEEARRRLGWSGSTPNVLFVGNPQLPRKNFVLANAVCDELVRRGRNVSLRVLWGVAPDQIPIWLSAGDALLFPSLSEGSPNTIKEAMAAELPIVSAPVGDVPERLHGVPGTFIVERRIEDMANALAAALEVGRATAAREAVADLSIERIAARILKVYCEAAGRARPSSDTRRLARARS